MQRQQLSTNCVVLTELGACTRDTDKMDKVFIREMREVVSRGPNNMVSLGGLNAGKERTWHLGNWSTAQRTTQSFRGKASSKYKGLRK